MSPVNVMPAIMESRWPSGFTRGSAPNIGTKYLASSTKILSDELIWSLSDDLELDMEQLALELGFSRNCSGPDGFYKWCNCPGSTVFVLVSVLANLGRTDCVHKIEEYIRMHTMQLFVKVEQATTDGSPYATSQKFHQVTTSCRFTLVQALENILGGDLVYYEIVGPGSWVRWTTLAKELKGQQLTLLHHSQPVPETREALYGSIEGDTELKQPVVAENVLSNTDTASVDRTLVKVLDYTQIDSLKCIPDPSVLPSSSKNATDSVEGEKKNFESTLAEEPTKACAFPSLDSVDHRYTLNSQTQVKVSAVSNANTTDYIQIVKCFPDKHLFTESSTNKAHQNVTCFPDKLLFTESTSKTAHQNVTCDESPLEALNNVPHFSLLEQSLKTASSNNLSLVMAQKPVIQNNTKSFEQVAQSPTKQANQNSALQITQNSLQCIQSHTLKTAQKSPSQSMQKSTVQVNEDSSLVCEKIQNNMNNLSGVTSPTSFHSSFNKNSLNSQSEKKASGSDSSLSVTGLGPASVSNQRSVSVTGQMFASITGQRPALVAGERPMSSLSQDENSFNNIVNNDDSQNQSASPSGTSMNSSDTDSLAGSLFANITNLQQFNISNCSPQDYVPHSCMPSMSGPLHNIVSLENKLLCGGNTKINTPPQKGHRLGCDSSADQQMIHSLQQILLERQMELKQRQLQQETQMRASPQIMLSCNGCTSAEDSQDRQTWQLLQRGNIQFFSQVDGQHQHVTQFQHNSFGSVAQNWSYRNWEKENQNFQASHLLQQHLHHSGQRWSEREDHSTDQPFLMCHTPPPSFPDTDSEFRNSPLLRFEQKQMPQSQQLNVSFIKHSNPNSPPENLQGQTMKVTNRTEQYVTMFGQVPIERGSPSSTCPIVKSSCHIPKSQTPPVLPNFEFTVKLPQSDPCSRLDDQQLILNHGNRSRSVSSASSCSSGVLSGVHNGTNGVLNDIQDSLIIPQPFYPAPPVSNALSGLDKTSRTFHGLMPRNDSLNDTTSTDDDDGYSYIDNDNLHRSRSLPVSHTNSPVISRRGISKLGAELQVLDGWCPQENGDTILNTMEKYRSKGGSFIIWRSRRIKKFVISVSHLNQLFHFRVEETRLENRDRTIYYLFDGGFRSESLLDLIQHYRQNSVRISKQSPNGQQIEHIPLCYPLRVH